MSRKIRRWISWLIALTALLIGISFLFLTIGAVHIPLKKTIFLLMQKILPSQGYPLESTPASVILFKIRLPRLILGIVVGASLSSAGVIFQGMFHNPLVEPYTLGVSGGAAVAVCLTIMAGLSHLIPLAGFIGAAGAVVLVYFIASSGGRLAIPTLLLTGVIVSFFSSSLIMLLMSLTKTEELHGIMFWIMGNLQETDFKLIIIISIALLTGIFFAFSFARDLNALNLGEEEAIHLGIEVERIKKTLFLLGSFLTGLSVSISGIIGFVGLMIPHFVRGLVSPDHRILLPASALFGAAFLVGADLVARTIVAPQELPVGIITGIAGGIIFICIIRRRKVEFRW